MLTIIRIEGVEEKLDKNGKKYWRTYAILSDGSEATGYGKDFDLNDRVINFYHYGQSKMKKYRV
jgi:hypothetical protein